MTTGIGNNHEQKKPACSACGTEPLKTKKTVNFFSGRTRKSVNQNQETTEGVWQRGSRCSDSAVMAVSYLSLPIEVGKNLTLIVEKVPEIDRVVGLKKSYLGPCL
jgi:hypothetical protein